MFQEDHPLSLWLMKSEIPTIRFLTLTLLMDLPKTHSKVQEAYRSIQLEGPVPAILNRQIDKGQWPYKNNYYTPKYVSTHWSLLLLKELLVDPQTPRFQDGVEYMLSATTNSIQEHGNQPTPDLQCLWSNIIRYAIFAGRIGDERLTMMIELNARSLAENQCICKYNNYLPCAWGVNRVMWALAAIPDEKRSSTVKGGLEKGIQFMLQQYDLLQANYPSPENKVHPLWFKLSFPLFYQSDILMTLRILADLDQLGQPAAQPALNWLESKRVKNGFWRGSSPFRQRTWPELADKEETNRWVSLYAAWILKKAGKKYDQIDPK
ncbi:MAG: hypothetical protein CL609_14865 [Anaerolineaceae bacterium]|nr:hypothetical protein [Anaerolineaceae bacterium]